MNGRRKWMFRLVAIVLVPLFIVGGIEWALRLAGYGYPTSFYLPATVRGQAVFIENQKFGWRFFPREAARTPRRTVMAADKPAETIRIFVLGESAALGDPEPDFGFGRILEVLLRDRFPGARFEAVNAAMTAINSHAIVSIADDCARHAGDFWLVYMGNNEVVGPYGAGTVFGPQTPPLAVLRANLWLKSTRIGQVLEAVQRWWRRGDQANRSWGGMEMFVDHQVRNDDPRLARVYHHFEKNLSDIIRLGRRSGARVLVSTVVGNVKDCAPFGSLSRPGLSENPTKQSQELLRQGLTFEEAGKHAEALAAYQQGAALDDQSADLAFCVGRSLLALDRTAEGKSWLNRARDLDTLRFRADTHLNEIIIRQATNRVQQGVHLVDSEALLNGHSPHGISGWEFVSEHVHFNFTGNYRLAVGFADQIAAGLPVKVRDGAKTNSAWLDETACGRHLAWTLWNQFEVAEVLRKRVELPPFTRQINHREHYVRLESEAKRLGGLLNSNRMREMLDIYTEALARAPEDWVLHFNLAKLHQRNGEHGFAVTEWRKVIERVPHHEEAFYHLGNALSQLGQEAEAMACFEKAIEILPNFHEAYNGLGLAYANQGRYEEAIALCQTALRLKPDFAAAHVNLGLVFSRQGRTEEAKSHYRTALKLKPDSAGAYVNLGKILNSEGQLGEASTHYLHALELDPDNALIHFNLGNTLAKLGKVTDAISHYREAIRLKSDFSEAQSTLGFELARQGKDAEAMGHFQEAIRINPDNAEAHLNLGVAYAKQQKMDDAIHHFREALRVDPDYATARRYLEAAEKRRQRN